jgi:hypothetical protein
MWHSRFRKFVSLASAGRFPFEALYACRYLNSVQRKLQLELFYKLRRWHCHVISLHFSTNLHAFM